ncbi:hypothetical protein [Algirhabdus cladophorae]|uniref:hypothetical protein n=1 Tax=Algirhabdus cladophorae TaxID=3377108 RepID=UPI003B846A18
MIKRIFGPLVVSVLAVGVAQAGSGRCPAWAQIDAPIAQNTFVSVSSVTGEAFGLGPALDTDAAVTLGGVRFEMPLGYRNPWPDKDRAEAMIAERAQDLKAQERPINVTSISPARTDPFAFWMPSGRIVERNMAQSPYLRPCEAGRAAPEAEDYVVRFGVLWPGGDGAEDDEATRRFRRATNALALTGSVATQKIAGTEHSLNGPITGTKNYGVYHDDGDLAVMLVCVERRGGQPAINPLCAGHVWDRAAQLVLAIRFPADQGQRGETPLWRAPVTRAVELAVSWRRQEN